MNGCLDSVNQRVTRIRHHISTPLYFLCFLSSYFVGAQNQIVFRVLDSTSSTYISDASILVTFSEDEKNRTVFDITDTNGYGKVEISKITDHDSIFISINHLNYNKFDTAYIWQEIKEQEIVTFLSARSYDLEPIIIQSVKINSYDTIHIVIDTSELKKSSKLTELLKMDQRFKLEDSYLSFNNKPISRILIDKTDMTGNNYISFLYQLSATDFESINVIQFYYDNPLDQYFHRPEVALRINTKKDGTIKKNLYRLTEAYPR